MDGSLCKNLNLAVPGTSPILRHEACSAEKMVKGVDLGALWKHVLQKRKTRNSDVGVRTLSLFLPSLFSVPPSLPHEGESAPFRISGNTQDSSLKKSKNTSMPCLKRCPHPTRMKKPVHPKNPDCTKPCRHECAHARAQARTRIRDVFALYHITQPHT